jgi:hypothetical protein
MGYFDSGRVIRMFAMSNSLQFITNQKTVIKIPGIPSN